MSTLPVSGSCDSFIQISANVRVNYDNLSLVLQKMKKLHVRNDFATFAEAVMVLTKLEPKAPHMEAKNL